MTRILAFLFIAVPCLAQSGSVNVAVGAIDGRGGGTRALKALQTQLKRVRGVRIQSTRGFLKEARAQRVEEFIRDDARAVSNVADALGVDVVLFGRITDPDRQAWPDARRRDKVVRVAIVAGSDGRVVAEHEVLAPRGKLTSRVWKEVVRAVEPDLFRAAEPPPPPPPPPPPVEEARPPPRFEEPISLDDDLDEPGDRHPGDLGSVRVGLRLVSRAFEYTATADSAQFAEGGIKYETSFVPGFQLEGEVYPLVPFTDGPARGIGIAASIEKVFLVTRQKTVDEMEEEVDEELDTAHFHWLARLQYRYAFGDESLAPFVRVFAGAGGLSVEVEENEKYNGNTYTYLDLGLGGSVPVAGKWVILDAEFHGAPVVGLGDTVEELGEESSPTGLGFYVGVTSLVTDEIEARLGFDYLSFGGDVKGEGRDGRIGERADDTYLGLKIQVGYRF